MSRTDTRLIPVIDGEVAELFPPTVEIPLLRLLPPVPPSPLPARLSPRRLPLYLRACRGFSAATTWIAYGPTEQRAFALLALAVLGAALCLIGVLPHWDAVDGPR